MTMSPEAQTGTEFMTRNVGASAAKARPNGARSDTCPKSPAVDMVRQHLAAVAHGDAYPNPKKAAASNGVTPRTARRWRTPHDAKGSPQDGYHVYLAESEDPWRLMAANQAAVVQQTLKAWTKEQLIVRYLEVLADDKRAEADDTANALARGVGWLDRAAGSERDAAHDLLKSAIEREFAVRGVTEAEVFGR